MPAILDECVILSPPRRAKNLSAQLLYRVQHVSANAELGLAHCFFSQEKNQ